MGSQMMDHRNMVLMDFASSTSEHAHAHPHSHALTRTLTAKIDGGREQVGL